MKRKQLVKIAADIAMTAVLLLLMTYELIGQVSHELLGIIMFVLFILHHILNSRWTKNLIWKNCSGSRIFCLLYCAETYPLLFGWDS